MIDPLRKCSLETWAPHRAIEMLKEMVGKTVLGMCPDCSSSKSVLRLSPNGDWCHTTTHDADCPSGMLRHLQTN